MKILIASDLHGSAYYTKQILQKLSDENAEILLLLGDIYNHGPRNPLPHGYATMEVAQLLNGVKDKLIVVKGNCDSAVDTMISEFDFIENICLISGGKKVFFTHGHIYNKDKPPKTQYDAVVYGHFHTGFIEKIGNTVFANAGSTSLPKNGTAHSYLILEDGLLTLKDIDGTVILNEKL